MTTTDSTPHRTRQVGDHQNVSHTDHDFGHLDAKWRTIGARVTTWEQDMEAVTEEEATAWRWGWYAVAPGHWYIFCPHATRNGATYGALQSTQWFTTAAERDRAIAKYLKGAAKRAEKIGSKA